MMYSIKKKQNPIKPEDSKFYATATYGEEIDIYQLANDISESCTLTVVDIVAVIQGLLKKMPQYLKNSNRIRLDNFGIFKLSFSAKGKEKEEDVTSNDITTLRVLFAPSSKLRNELSDVSFSKK